MYIHGICVMILVPFITIVLSTVSKHYNLTNLAISKLRERERISNLLNLVLK